jgi:ATP-dependent HslUV protease ATP-binding subunit HslU
MTKNKEKILEATAFSPREIVSELDKNIIGQHDAKRAVSIALRNRWRRMQLDPAMQEEVYPKNILMVGPTGVGKTEIARRLAKLAQAPFVKVEATKFTEVGYVGKDVESIIRDLVEASIHMVRDKMRKSVTAQAEMYAEERVLDALVGDEASETTRNSFREKLRNGDFDDKEIELDLKDTTNPMAGMMDLPDMPGASVSMMSIGDMFGKGMQKTKRKKMTVEESYDILMAEEADKLLDEDKVIQNALELVQQNGIVFLDEVDKIAVQNNAGRGEVSREGVQRDLLPLIEGTTVNTKHGPVKTDHILFIASGAFHYAKPSDLLAELQGRLPIRVELRALTEEDFVRILTETQNSLIKQYKALIGTEGVTLDFTDDAIKEIARISFEVNETVENIGARRLLTVMEKLLDDLSFTASDRSGESITIDKQDVLDNVADLTDNADLSKFIL